MKAKGYTIFLMSKRILPYFTLILIVLGSTLILWLPFLLRLMNLSMLDIYRNYDGPLYVIPAKTLYDIDKIDIPGKGLIISLPLHAKYFAAHLPLYPLFIRLFSTILGYLKSMVFVNLLFTVFLAWFFYYFVKTLKLTQRPLVLTAVFLILPRFLVVRSVGSPESLFILLTLFSLFFFEKSNYLLAGLTGGLATMTKSPGILLFVAYTYVVIERIIRTRKFDRRYFYLLLIPLGLLTVFGIYAVQMKDFFAYFHSGDNIHLVYPFSVFNFKVPWVGTPWLEDVLFYFFMYLLAVVILKDIKYRSVFFFSLVFFIAVTFVQHRDISRYSLALWPLACIAFERFFTSKRFLIVLIILLPAIYLYAWNFLLYNLMPIGDMKPFL